MNSEDNVAIKEVMERWLKKDVDIVVGICKEKKPDVHDVLKYYEESIGMQTIQLCCCRLIPYFQAANGAGAQHGDPVAVILQYRGLAFQIGGDKSLDQHVTVTSILKQFNPKLVGYSTGIGSSNVWEISQFNQAVPGAETIDMPTQARRLVNLMQTHSEVDIKKDWKLVNIFIGANDMCAYCTTNGTVSFMTSFFPPRS